MYIVLSMKLEKEIREKEKSEEFGVGLREVKAKLEEFVAYREWFRKLSENTPE